MTSLSGDVGRVSVPAVRRVGQIERGQHAIDAQPSGAAALRVDVSRKAAPGVSLDSTPVGHDHACSDGIQMNVRADQQKEGVVARLYQQRLVAALKEMAVQIVPVVVAGGVGSLQPLHAVHQIRLAGFDQQVVMVGHQHVGMDDPARLAAGVGQGVEESLAIGVAS